MRLYAEELDRAVYEALKPGKGYTRAEVAGLFAEEPIEAIGRALQRLTRLGMLASQGYRASTSYTRMPTKKKDRDK